MRSASASPSPSGSSVPFPSLGSADIRLLSKRTMEIQAEEGIRLVRPSPRAAAISGPSAFNPFNDFVRSKTPEPGHTGSGSLLDDFRPDSAQDPDDQGNHEGKASAAISTAPPGFRRSRADTLPSSFSALSLSDSAAPPAGPAPLPPAGLLRMSASTTNLRSSISRNRGTSLNLPPMALKEAFGPGVYTSAWLSGGLEDLAMPSPVATRNQIEEMNSSLAKTLDYLGLDEACMSPLEPKRHDFGLPAAGPPASRPVHPSVLDLQNAGRIRSFSLTSADLEDEISTGPVNPKLVHLMGNHSTRARTISNPYADIGFQSRVPSSLSESVSAAQLQDDASEPAPYHRAGSPLSNGRSALSRSHTPVNGYTTGSLGLSRPESAVPSRSHTPRGSVNLTAAELAELRNCKGGSSPDGSGGDGQAPTRSLWVGNVDPALSTADLMTVFTPFGPVESLRLLPDKECAFINFNRVEDAIRARDEMQNGKIGNCVVRVGFGKGDNYASVDAQAMQPTRAIWIGNISAATTPAALQSVFSAFGPIESARVLTHKNCGFVNFEKLEDAVRAKKAMNGKEIADSVVRIGYAKVPSKSETGGRTRVASTASPLPSQRLTPWITPAPAVDPSLNPDDVLEPGANLIIDEQLVAYNYLSALPPLAEPAPGQRLDQGRLRELRKRLDGHPTTREVDAAFEELFPVCVDLCTDYIGNTIVQKFMDRCNPEQKQRLIEAVAPYTAAIGTHKNGTWAIQKMVEGAQGAAQVTPFVHAVKPTTPPLMLDQLGNYVVQCCLRFGGGRNQFIFDAIHARCWEIAQGRFGARAIRTCLEHPMTTRKQQRLVVIALVNNAVALTTNANGSLLINWLLDSSGFHGRYRVLAPRLADHLGHLGTHKLGTLVVLKLINQRAELDARDLILGRLFFDPATAVLEDVLSDQVHGVSLVQKILSGNALVEMQKRAVAESVREVLLRLQVFSVQGYRRLLEELDHILQTNLATQPPALGGVGGGTPVHLPSPHHPHHHLHQHVHGPPGGAAAPYAVNGYTGATTPAGFVASGQPASPPGTGYPYNNVLMYNPLFPPAYPPTYGMVNPPLHLHGPHHGPGSLMVPNGLTATTDSERQHLLMATLANGGGVSSAPSGLNDSAVSQADGGGLAMRMGVGRRPVSADNSQLAST
ncbi:hypothetical protein IWQ60_002453 [Tieghemiomyces parasiticus]|uniref:PUM-HD domain-containing protein n=1 Tax=Tieghemiomyces parasiticus TaxID=78921 RepID=A0A9W8AC89_9FUNG|nr:hypothetical protein IWQ60_002453 [Tieghemiomyces parasiticus]